MSFGRKAPAPPQLPRQPTPPELMDFIDEISGVETVTITRDGKKRRVTRRLPLTPQEEEIMGKAGELLQQSVNNIEALYKYNPDAVANYQPFIQAFLDVNNERSADLAQIGNFQDLEQNVKSFADINRRLVNKSYDRSEHMSEEMLAKRGLANSTMAAEQRAANAGERALAVQQSDAMAAMQGEDLASRQLMRENALYEARDKGRQGRLQQAEAGFTLESQRLNQLEQLRQTAIEENMNRAAFAQSLQGNEQKSQLGMQSNQLAIGQQNAAAKDQMNRYNSNINTITQQHRLNTEAFQNNPATFGQTFGNMGMAYLGSKIPGALDSAGSYLGKRLGFGGA